MPADVHQMKRIFDNPNHPNYGPVRRLWIMLEQLFPEGVERFEARLKIYHDRQETVPPKFDEHLDALIRMGQGEADAQRMVLQQMFSAREWIS